MVNVSTASVVAAHYHANNSRPVGCHSAQPGITQDKLSDAFFVIALRDLHTFASLPELKRGVVILDRKFPSNDLFAHLVVEASTTISSCHSERREAATQSRKYSGRGQAFNL